MIPKYDLLALWEETFEMKQEKQALYGEPHSQANPYSLSLSRNSDQELLRDQTESFHNQSLKELQGPAPAEPAQDPRSSSFL